LSKTPAIGKLHGDGATTKTPVPGGNNRSTDQTPFEKVELVSKVKVVGFHKETVVPCGTVGGPDPGNIWLR
jgi:hypothetical protein